MIDVRITVSGAGSLIGQAVLKSIRHASNHIPCLVQGLDYFDDALGFRWCDKTGILPDLLSPQVSEDQWLDVMCEQLAAFGSRYLFVGADFELVPLAARSKEIMDRTGCRVIVSGVEMVRACKDKLETFSMLKALGFGVPESLSPDASFSKIAGQLGTPFIVKPRFGSRSRNLFVVETEPQFESALRDCNLPVAQEYLPGDGTEFSCGVNVLGERVDSVCVLRRTLRDGNTSKAFSGEYPEVEDYCRALGETLKPFGPINIQLRLQDGRPKTFEINPRFSGTTYFRTLLGVNEVSRTLCFFEGLDLPENPRMRTGIVRRYFDEFVEAATS